MNESHNELESASVRSAKVNADRLSTIPRREAEPVELAFDWEPVSLAAPHLITFLLSVGRREEQSSVRFRIDLHQLPEDDCERLHAFLSRRHSGLTTAHDLAWHASWLLDRWLAQTKPELPLPERHARVRELLLVASSSGHH